MSDPMSIHGRRVFCTSTVQPGSQETFPVLTSRHQIKEPRWVECVRSAEEKQGGACESRDGAEGGTVGSGDREKGVLRQPSRASKPKPPNQPPFSGSRQGPELRPTEGNSQQQAQLRSPLDSSSRTRGVCVSRTSVTALPGQPVPLVYTDVSRGECPSSPNPCMFPDQALQGLRSLENA